MTIWRAQPSRPTHAQRRAWLAWLAVLTLAVVPTISRALVPLAPSQFIADLCRSGDVAPGHDALVACAVCWVATTPPLPPTVASIRQAPQRVATWLAPPPVMSWARAVRAPAQARAPPSSG